jgi:hypothetical protein
MFESRKKTEARKMPVNRADSQPSAARFVSLRFSRNIFASLCSVALFINQTGCQFDLLDFA